MNNLQHPGRPAPQPQAQAPQQEQAGLGSIFSPNPKLIAAKQEAAAKSQQGLGVIGQPEANPVVELASAIQNGQVSREQLSQIDPGLATAAIDLVNSSKTA